MHSGRPGTTAKNQKSVQKQKDVKNPNVEHNSPGSSILNFFRSQQSSQKQLNESFSSISSVETSLNGTIVDPMTELPQMVSILEARRKSLEERKIEISLIRDEQIKKVLLDMIDDMKNVVEDSDKILQCHNDMVNRQNEDSEEIQSNRASINNLTKGVGNLTDGISEVKNRVQSLEVSKNCNFDSHFINIVFVNGRDADCVEKGTIGPKQKFGEILSEMKIVSPKDIIDAHLMTASRFVNRKRKQIKLLRARFNDSLTAGRIFAQIINHNKNLTDEGKQDALKYYAEMPASKNVWNLKRVCYELKNEGTLVNVRGSDRGILVSYKVKNRDDDKESIRNCTVTSEREIDDLRKLLNVEDAYISVTTKYNDDFWNKKKKKPVMEKKRGRDDDENDIIIDSKRLNSGSNTQ
ncbi:hypothetical protein ACKWTF_007600 [Chironomus riparius]